MKVQNLGLRLIPECVTDPLIFQETNRLTFCFLAMVRNPKTGLLEDGGLAVWRTTTLVQMKSGHPNDEALSAHPLFKEGFDGTFIAEIDGSPWIDDVVALNQANFPHFDFGRGLRHLVFSFKETTLELLLRDFTWHLSEEPYEQVRRAMLDWLEGSLS